MIQEVGFALDSPLEQRRFEPPVARRGIYNDGIRFVPENQVRTRLPAGAKGIRTLGPSREGVT